jgi:hypothetical protein
LLKPVYYENQLGELNLETYSEYLQRVKNEILDSKYYLEKLIKKNIYILAWPWGESNTLLNEIAKSSGFKFTLNTHFGRNYNSSPYTRYSLKPHITRQILFNFFNFGLNGIFSPFKIKIYSLIKYLFKFFNSKSSARELFEMNVINVINSNKKCKYNVLFIGVADYTFKYYTNVFHDYVTLDYNIKIAYKYGSKIPICDSILNINKYYNSKNFDFIIFNGVIGYGLNNLEEIILTIQNLNNLLKTNGTFICGYNKNNHMLNYEDLENYLKEFKNCNLPSGVSSVNLDKYLGYTLRAWTV